ncbi:cell wall hydrolase [Sphingomonas pokkalii]|uniref:Cell wall hydrolase n=1 Tax=Sphingomonas pokkalii TaxID=2175090 RepID=A0A2U0SGN1_9SPHN|nr:cell wall hydrolase [Sphingomonas pokkalii]PVX30481.1 cell wall hydrolase [Sphingomonas pokkalii]
MISHARRSSLALLGFGVIVGGAGAALLLSSFGPAELLAPVPESLPATGQTGAESLPAIESFLPDQNLALDPDAARARNQALPFDRGPNPPAQPFQANWLAPAELEQGLECLTAAIYYEATTESVAGQRAVAQVVLNRLRHPRFPKRICDVVYQGAERHTGCQFTFACDGSLARPHIPRRWLIAKAIANAALHGAISASVGQATHYHAAYVFARWAPELRKVAMIGTHIFYAPHQRYGAFPLTVTAPAPIPTATPGPVPTLSLPPVAAPAIATSTAPRAEPSPQAARAGGTPPMAAASPAAAPSPIPSPKAQSAAPAFPIRRAPRRLPLPGQD